MTLNRQVQRRISRMQVAVSERPVGHPGDRHLTEHRPQHAAMIVFNPTAGHLIVTDHRLQTLLTDRALAPGDLVEARVVESAGADLVARA